MILDYCLSSISNQHKIVHNYFSMITIQLSEDWRKILQTKV